MKPYVLECSCCVSHIVPFLIHYLCNTSYFLFLPYFLVPVIVFLLLHRQRAQEHFYTLNWRIFDALIKHETLNQRNKFTSLTAWFGSFFLRRYWVSLITLKWCYRVILFKGTRSAFTVPNLEGMPGRADNLSIFMPQIHPWNQCCLSWLATLLCLPFFPLLETFQTTREVFKCSSLSLSIVFQKKSNWAQVSIYNQRIPGWQSSPEMSPFAKIKQLCLRWMHLILIHFKMDSTSSPSHLGTLWNWI